LLIIMWAQIFLSKHQLTETCSRGVTLCMFFMESFSRLQPGILSAKLMRSNPKYRSPLFLEIQRESSFERKLEKNYHIYCLKGQKEDNSHVQGLIPLLRCHGGRSYWHCKRLLQELVPLFNDVQCLSFLSLWEEGCQM